MAQVIAPTDGGGANGGKTGNTGTNTGSTPKVGQVTGATLSPIYDRLNSAPEYHPLEADTFADWSLEAGDLVTVSRDNRDYQSPVHSSTVRWAKKQQVQISSTGNEKRDSVEKMSRNKYRSGSSGLRNSNKLYTFDVNINGLYHEVYDTNGKFSKLQNTANGLYHEVYDTNGRFGKLQNTANGLYHEVYDTNGKLSTLQNTTDGLYHEVYDANGLKTTVQTHAGTFSVLCSATGNNAKLKPAAIQAGINAATGQSKITLSANNITLDGNAVATSLEGHRLSALGVQCSDLTITGGDLIFQEDCMIGDQEANNLIVNASVENNVLTLTKYDGTEITFSRATTLNGAWSGGVYTVSASPQGNRQSTTLHSIVVDENLAPSGTSVRAYLKIHYATGNPQSPSADTGFTRQLVSLSGATVYTNGQHNGWDLARGKVSPPSEQTTNAYIDVGIPASTYNQGSSYRFTLDCDSNYVYIKNSLNKVVARKANVSTELVMTAVTLHNSNDSPGSVSGYTYNSHGYYYRGSGTSRTIRVYSYPTVTVNGETLEDQTIYDYLQQVPSYVYTDGYSDGSTNGWDLARKKVSPPSESTSNAYFDVGIPASTYNQGSSYRYTIYTSGKYAYAKDATDKNVARVAITFEDPSTYVMHNWEAASTPSGYTEVDHSGRKYYISGSGTSANVRVYCYSTVTVNGVTVDASQNQDAQGNTKRDYLSGIPSDVYHDAYSSGFDATTNHHDMKIYKDDYTGERTSGTTYVIPRGSTWTLYPGFKKSTSSSVSSDDDIIWGSGVSFQAQPGTLFTMKCTSKTDASGGQGTAYKYTFEGTFGTNIANFALNTNYNFYRFS